MKRKTNSILALFGIIAVSAVSVPFNASAFSITQDKPRIYVDGGGEDEVTVKVSKGSSQDSFSYGYFLNDSNEFTNLDDTRSYRFRGGDKIDFAIYNPSKTKYYRLSDGKGDNSYNVEVNFDQDANGNGATQGDYHDAHIKWSIPGESNSVECRLDLHDDNNGYTTVPEPATLFLMGSGMVGYALLRRKRKN